MRRLLAVEMPEATPMGEQRHDDELGERPSMDAARGGDEDVGIPQAERANELPDAGAGGLHPFEPRRDGDIFGRARQIPKNLGAG